MLKKSSLRNLSAFLLMMNLIAGFAARPANAQTYHQIQITNTADDGYFNNQNGTGWHSTPENSSHSADWIGSWGGTTNAWLGGYRFPSTGINSDDTIQSAYIKLVSSQDDASSATCGEAPCANTNSTFRVYGVAQDDGAPFSGTPGNTPADVPYTTAFTDYTSTGPGDVHGSCQGNNNGQNTCTHIIDVTSIVKEITSRLGWTNTSAIRFVMKSMDPSGPNVRTGFEDVSASSTRAATLVVNPPLPVVVSSGAWGTSASLVYPLTYQTGPFVYPGASTLLLFLGDYYNFDGRIVDQPTITDSCGNHWSVLDGPANYVAYFYNMRGTIYYVQNPAPCTAGDTITVTTDNQEPIFMHFVAVAGSNTSQAPVVSAFTNPGASGVYTTSATTNPVTLANQGLLMSWAFGDSDAPHTFTPQSGFITDPNSTPNYLTTTYENVSSGTYTNTFSISPSDGWETVLIGLPSSSGGGGGGTPAPSITSPTTAKGTVGTAFSYQITATNSPKSYGATGLPAGLSVNTSTGLISGTPTAAGTSTVTLSAGNAGGTGTATLSLTIAAPGAPVITSATTANGMVRTAFSYQITATNSPTSYNATGLPAGLSVNTSTGLISGTPTTAGGWTATLSATNAGGTGTATLTITVASGGAPSIAFAQESATASSAMAQSLSIPFAGNTLPGDFILVAFDFSPTATPSSITDSQGNAFAEVGTQLLSPGGSASRVYYAKNIKGGSDTVTISLSANSAWIEAYLTEYSGVDPTNPIDAQAGTSGGAGAVSSGAAQTSNLGDAIFGFCPADWACTAGSGFTARSTFNHNLVEDAMAGSPGSYAATATANNGWTMQLVALKPASAATAMPPSITSATAANGTIGSAFSFQITATSSPTSFGATGLPPGLSVNTSSGVIAGTPTVSGSFTVTLSATNSSGTGTATLALTIKVATPVITSATSASGTAGFAFSYQISATNSPTSFNATGLPAGLSVNTSTGVIAGTPTVSGSFTVTLSATNAGGTGTAALTIAIAVGPPVITSATTASGTAGTAFSYQITATNSPTSYNATALPAGLSVNTATGRISGTPTAAGTSMVTLSATNASGTGTATLTLTIDATVTHSIAFVQAAAKATPSKTRSLAISFPAKTLAGDLILVGFDYTPTASFSSITDSQGNTFAQAGTQLVSPGGSASRVYYAKNIKGGLDTVTITFTASTPMIEGYLTEYSGVDPTNPIDALAGASGGAGVVSSGTVQTSSTADVIYGFCPADWGCTVGSGFTARSTFNSNLVEDGLAGAPGLYAATATANNGWTMQMVALKPAP